MLRATTRRADGPFLRRYGTNPVRLESSASHQRLTAPFRFVVVGAPSYLDARGRPPSPRALRRHRCVVFRAPSTGALTRWDLERQGRSYEVAVEGPVISDSAELMLRAARDGLGLAYLYEPMAAADLARGALEIVLEEYAPEVPGFFLYFPRSARNEPKLRAFLAHARRASGLAGGPPSPV